MNDQPDVSVHDDPDRHRYVATLDGQEVGYVVYYRAQGRHLLVHTEVGDSHQGQGVGSQLVRGALDDVRDSGGSVVALCPYVQRWIGEHDDYASLVDDEMETYLRP